MQLISVCLCWDPLPHHVALWLSLGSMEIYSLLAFQRQRCILLSLLSPLSLPHQQSQSVTHSHSPLRAKCQSSWAQMPRDTRQALPRPLAFSTLLIVIHWLKCFCHLTSYHLQNERPVCLPFLQETSPKPDVLLTLLSVCFG